MPLDEVAGGCGEVIFRFVFEVVGEGLLRLFWAICQFTGAVIVWVLTLGRVNLLQESEHAAGVIGLVVYALLIYWLVQKFT